MYDLTLTYQKIQGTTVERKYDTIMDFLSEIENKDKDAPPIHSLVKKAVFFENPRNIKKDCNVWDLYNHCKKILK